MSRRQYKGKYMHLLNCEAATFDGEQIVRVRARGTVRLANSLQQIRAEQRAARRFRRAQGFAELDRKYPMQFGYVRVI